MTMSNSIIRIILLVWILNIVSCNVGVIIEEISDETALLVTINVKEQFITPCIIFINFDHSLQYVANLINMQKRASRALHLTNIINWTEIKKTFPWLHRQYVRPFFVILTWRYYEAINKALQKLSHDLAGQMASAKWLLFTDSTQPRGGLLSGVNIPFNCEFLVAQPVTISGQIALFEMFSIYPEKQLHQQRLEYWDNNRLRRPLRYIYKRRENLHAHRLKAVTRELIPYRISLSKKRTSQNQRYNLCGFLVKLLEEDLNVKFDEIEVESSQVGILFNNNNSWTGMIGLVSQKQVHLMTSPIILQSTRAKFVKFLMPLTMSTLRIFIQDPHKVLHGLTKFFWPLEKTTWLCVFLTIFLVTLITSFLVKIRSKFEKISYLEIDNYTLNHTILRVFGCFCQQGQDYVSLSIALRIVTIFVYMCSIIIYTSYSASLISYLSAEETVVPFTDLESLYQMGSYSVGVERRGAVYSQLNVTKVSMLRTYALHSKGFIMARDVTLFANHWC